MGAVVAEKQSGIVAQGLVQTQVVALLHKLGLYCIGGINFTVFFRLFWGVMQLRPIVATGAKADRAAGGLGIRVFQFSIDHTACEAVVFGGHIAVVHIDLFDQ